MPTQVEEKSVAGGQVDRLTQDLIGVVAREAEQLDTLWQLLSRQQRFLVEGNVAAVEANVQEQEQVIRISRELEGERCRLLCRVAEQLAGDPRAMTLAKLAELLSGSYATRLNELRGTLVSITQNIERARRQNEMLITRSLFHIGETMRLLAGSAATVPAYSANPAVRAPGAALLNRVG